MRRSHPPHQQGWNESRRQSARAMQRLPQQEDRDRRWRIWTVKVGPKTRVAYEFYGRLAREGICVGGKELPVMAGHPRGCTALEAFAVHDSCGAVRRCREPRQLRDVFRAKAGLNLQIKMWAEGVAEWTTFIWELRADNTFAWFPEWVWLAVERQATKIRYAKSERQSYWQTSAKQR